MERNNRRKPTQPQQQHYNDSNGTAPNNSSWLDWNADENDYGAPSSGIGNSTQHERSKSAPKQRRAQHVQNESNNYGKLHSPTKKKHHGISLHLTRPKSAGKQRSTPNNDGGVVSATGDVNAANATGHSTQQGGGGGNNKHHSWASSLLQRKKQSKSQHENNSNNTHTLATPSSSSGNRTKAQTKTRNSTGAPSNVCDYCQKVVPNKSRAQMYQRAGYVYCSTMCTKFHHQALDAEEKGANATARIGMAAKGGTLNNARHTPSKSNANNTKIDNIKSKPPIDDLRIPEQQQQNQHHLLNVSYEKNTGNQFIPSTAKAASALSSSSNSSIPQSNVQFPQNWFHHESNDSDNGIIDIMEDNYTISFGNSWGASGVQHPSLEGQNSSQSTNNSQSALPPINSDPTNRYGRGITDEYKDYNDELSRQLRFAARQDELEMEERLLRRRKFIDTHHQQPQQHHQQQFSSAGSNASGSGFSTGSGGGGGGGGNWSGGARNSSSSSGRYHAVLKNIGVDGFTANKNNAKELKSTSRPKYPILKQNETSTQSTGSFSSSSQGGNNSHDIGSRSSGNGPGGFAHHMGGRTSSSSTTSWGYLNIGIIPESDVAFEELSNDNWPNKDDDGMNRDDAKTPRKGNLSVMFAVQNCNEDMDCVGTEEPGGEEPNGIDPEGQRKDDNVSKNQNQNRRMPSRSSPPPPSLYAISEEQSVGPMDAPAINQGGDWDLASLQLLAQKRGLRPIAPQPTSSTNPKPASSESHTNVWADHAVEDVVSIVSYYDDPSVEMLSSLATNDTRTTISHQRAGRRSPPFSLSSPGETSRLPVPKMRPSGILKSQQQQPRSDPPGNSIDEILKEGGLRHQQGMHGHHNGRDASFQGVDPDEQLVDEQERNVEQTHSPQGLHQQRHKFKTTAQFDNKSKPMQERQEERTNTHQHPQQKKEKPQYGRSPEIVAPPQLRPSQQHWRWLEKGPTNNENGRKHVKEVETGDFEVGGIEFPTHQMLDGDDTSIGMLTGEEEDEPPISNRGDDDTATNTLETVDLVAEVKRVWRHVQRYETKKQRKKEMKRLLRKNSRGVVDAADSGNVLNDMDNDEMERIRENDNAMMGQLLQQFSEMQHEPRYHNDGDSKLSDITPFSSSNRAQSRSRGRTSERPPMIPDDGRLGTHIRGTSLHSRTHAEPPDSPGLDSNQAMASQASTEKDAVFLNEGVDEFYDGQAKPTMNGHGTISAAYSHPASSSAQRQQSSRINQIRTQYLSKVQPVSKTTPQQYSRGHVEEEDIGKITANQNKLLSTPYDMTKTKSTGTSFTQKTQQTSNMTTSQPSKLRSDMARKYMKQKPHVHYSTNLGASAVPPQDLHEHQQPASQKQRKQPASPSRLYSKAMQSARTPRTNPINRVS